MFIVDPRVHSSVRPSLHRYGDSLQGPRLDLAATALASVRLVGTALAIIIGFKNNASYGRLWEARKVGGSIVNASCLVATMVNDFITNDRSESPMGDEDFFALRKRMILRHVAWMTSLRHALRAKKPWESSGFTIQDDDAHRRRLRTPIEGIANHGPISTMARGIEIDIREMIGEPKEDIPAPRQETANIKM